MINKTYESKDITIVEENTKLPGVFIEYLMTKLQNIRNGLMPEARINVCILITGDHLYQFRADVLSDGKETKFNFVNNDPFRAIDNLLDNMKVYAAKR
jgi:hypothetical protein